MTKVWVLTRSARAVGGVVAIAVALQDLAVLALQKAFDLVPAAEACIARGARFLKSLEGDET